MDKLLRNCGSQLKTVGLANERQHHVNRGRSTRTAHAPLAPLVEFICDFYFGIAFLERQLGLPMQSHRVAL